MHGCRPTPQIMHTHSSMWDQAHKVTIWDGRGTCHTFTSAYVKDQDDKDHVKVKILRKRLADSPLPSDLNGWELFASMDDECDETYGQATINSSSNVGRHKIVTIPDGGPKIFTP